MNNIPKALTPKLRFPEFRDAGPWERRMLSDLLMERKQRNRELRYASEDVLSVSGEYGCVNQIDLLGRSYAGVSLKEYSVVETGDLVYTKSPLKRNPFGIIKANKGRPGIVSTLYAVYSVTDMGHPAYLDHYFSRDYNLNSYLQPIVRKGAKNDMKVNNAAVLRGEIFAPGVEEQEKVARFLTSLNEVIAAERRKLKALRAHKRGLTDQLFPREGEGRPRLRFPEFSDEPDWEKGVLGERVTFQSGGTPSKSNPAFWNGSIPWVSAKDMKQFLLDDTEDHISPAAAHDGAKLAPAGALLVLIRGMTLLKDVPVCYLQREMSFNQDVRSITPMDDLNALFLGYLLWGSKQRLMRMVDRAGHGTGRLETERLRTFGVALPLPAEQQRIASSLSSLEALIAAQSRKVDGLRAYKNGFMQQLFASPAPEAL